MSAPDLTEVLALVNKGRVAASLEPLDALPKGRPARPCECVIAKAFDGAEVDGETLTVPGPNTQWPDELYGAWNRPIPEHETTDFIGLPQLLRDFVRHFDDGAYPQLIDLGYPMNRNQFRIRNIQGGIHWIHMPKGQPADWDICSATFETEEQAQADLDRFFKEAGI